MDLSGDVEVAAGHHGEAAFPDLGKKVGAACDFPGIKFLRQLPAAVPEVVGLFFYFASRDGVRGDRKGALRSDGATELERVGIRVKEVRDAEGDDVRGSIVEDVVFGELEARNDDHAILIPGSGRLRPDDLEIEGKRRGREGMTDVARRDSREALAFAKVVGDRDRAKTSKAVEVDQLGDRELSVAERGVNVEVSQISH